MPETKQGSESVELSRIEVGTKLYCLTNHTDVFECGITYH